MLLVRKDLCLGCGLCVESCPRQAISIVLDQAEINQDRCNQCGVCLDICPQGAIVEVTPVSSKELENTVGTLKQRTDDLIQRIEKLQQQPARSDSK